MLIRILILLCLLPAGFFTSRANTFIVTSNADSGPGTLREAIMFANANGIASSDSIIFNIPDVSRTGRTIVLISELPELTSKIIIDGTTQTGIPIGVSDAKIILLINTPQTSVFTFFRFSNASNIEIYGLFLFNEILTMFTPYMPVNGINFVKSSNIIIGKAGKGNYFRGLGYAISSFVATVDDYYLINSADITIQSNIFNNDENGDATIAYSNNIWGYINPMEYGIYLFNTKNIKIGGDQANEGNTIMAQNIFIQSNITTNNGFLIIKNNFIGIKTDGTITFQSGSPKILIVIRGNYSDRLTDYDISIIKNRVNGEFVIFYHSKKIVIQGNKIFDTGGNGNVTVFNLKLFVSSCTGGGIIGGDLTEEQNEIFTFGPMLNHHQWSNIPTGAILVIASPNFLIKKNKTYCTAHYGAGILVSQSNEPHIQIDLISPGFVKGKATPGCNIEIFLDDDCWACDGIAFLGTTVSNTDSSWSFSGNFNGVVIATATRPDGTSSGYTEPTYRLDNVLIKQPTCRLNNGSIKGIRLIHSWNNIEWHKTFMRDNDFIDTLISTNIDLINLEPGDYYFVAKLGETCKSPVTYFRLIDVTPAVDESNAIITHPGCGLFNGSISGVIFSNNQYSLIEWKNEQGNVISNSTILTGIAPGRYKAYIRDTTSTGGCIDSTNWFDLINQSGPSLNTNNIQINPATCGNANGSIKGISSNNVTGTPFIQWLDSLNNPVGSSFDLTNMAAGKYKLKFKDQSGCDTIITPFYTIQGLGAITIDISQLATTASECAYASGTITGINIAGATGYQWVNASGQAVSNSLVPGSVFPGSYILIATNSLGCEKRTDSIRVSTNPYMSFTPPLQAQLRPGSCDLLNGYVNLLNFPSPQNFIFRWIDSLQPNVVISTSMNLTNVNSGTFKLFAKNTAGCEQQVMTAILPYFQPPVISENNISVTDEICNNQSGSIKGLTVNSGSGVVPFTYTWIDLNNNVISSTQDISNIPAGSYSLVVIDGAGCFDTSNVIQVNNKFVQLNQPQYADQYIKINTSTTLIVQNQQQGTYLLFDNSSVTIPLQQNNSGVFVTQVLPTDKTFYVQLIIGNCASSKTPVKVIVYDKTNVFVPSGFTPNNDGRNDILKVRAFGPVKLDYFRIYNRWGEIIFSTNDISRGWDGKLRGIQQPTSIFVWMIKAKDEITGEIFEKRGTVTLIK